MPFRRGAVHGLVVVLVVESKTNRYSTRTWIGGGFK